MQAFLDSEEPILNNDTESHALDEPPPLPPRIQSLNLPLAPKTDGNLSLNVRAAHANGAEEMDDRIGDKLSSKDALNNFINQHDMIRDAEVADSLGSLPPLPSRPALDESDSDDDYLQDDDDDEDDDGDNDNDDDDDDIDEEYETINEHDAEPIDTHVPTTATTTQQPHADDLNANNEPASPAGEQHKINGVDVGQLSAR